MSAPHTNIDKQTRRHRWPLIGMAVAVVIGVGSTFFWLTDEVAEGDPPVEGQVLPDGETTLPVDPVPSN